MTNRVVPVEPTSAMVECGFKSNTILLSYDTVRTIYKAMLAVAPEQPSREGFYEKLWKDFVSLQRGDAQGICKKVEQYYREQPSREAATELPPEPNKLNISFGRNGYYTTGYVVRSEDYEVLRACAIVQRDENACLRKEITFEREWKDQYYKQSMNQMEELAALKAAAVTSETSKPELPEGFRQDEKGNIVRITNEYVDQLERELAALKDTSEEVDEVRKILGAYGGPDPSYISTQAMAEAAIAENAALKAKLAEAEQDALALGLRLYLEDWNSFAPETYDVMTKLRIKLDTAIDSARKESCSPPLETICPVCGGKSVGPCSLHSCTAREEQL